MKLVAHGILQKNKKKVRQYHSFVHNYFHLIGLVIADFKGGMAGRELTGISTEDLEFFFLINFMFVGSKINYMPGYKILVIFEQLKLNRTSLAKNIIIHKKISHLEMWNDEID